MSADAWITAATLLLTLLALALSRYPPAAIVLTATITLLVLGVIDPHRRSRGSPTPRR